MYPDQYYATLRVSEECYTEIKEQMIEAGYDSQRFPLYLWGKGADIRERLIDLNQFALGKKSECAVAKEKMKHQTAVVETAKQFVAHRPPILFESEKKCQLYDKLVEALARLVGDDK